VIDLHCHLLPGLDDGPADTEGSVALARAAWERGTRTMVATPHIRDDHPFALEEIPRRAQELRAALSDAGEELEVVTGGELAISKAMELDDQTLSALCLGDGPYLLVESPYTYAPQLLENVLFDLQSRGFRPVLAHPERSPSFLSDLPRLERIAERGVLCSVTALSMAGGFGAPVRRFSAQLFAKGLVHDVASDAHYERQRPPGLGEGFERLEAELPGIASQSDWFTLEAPRAILAGEDLPQPPAPPSLARQGIARFLRRN
jgi:protein-tyrosine phosphatase